MDLDEVAFTGLDWNIDRVLIVENRAVFLCLPELCSTLAVFGSGKAASMLPQCKWLRTVDAVVYWGDCDEAGFGILSSLRANLPQTRSLLMDHDSWVRWKHLATSGNRDITARHTHLTPSERAALAEILKGPSMLEQERIPAAAAVEAMYEAFGIRPSS
jgi:hypothetical protein